MSPTLKVYHNFVPFMTNLQGCISFLLPPDSFAKSCTRLHRFLQYMSSFWNSPGGGITTLDFNASNCIGHNGTGLWTSDKDSDVMGLVLTIASTSARNVWSDSSFRLVPCIFSSATKIECVGLIWHSHIPPIFLAVGGFLFHWIHWPPCSSMNSLIFLWFISENALFSSALAPTKFVPLLVLMTQTLPLLDTNLQSACMKASVDSEFVDSIWIALLERQVKRHPYLFISLRPSFTKMGPNMSIPQYVNGGSWESLSLGKSAIFCWHILPLRCLQMTHFAINDLTALLQLINN